MGMSQNVYTTKLKNLSDRIGYYGTHIFSIFFKI